MLSSKTAVCKKNRRSEGSIFWSRESCTIPRFMLKLCRYDLRACLKNALVIFLIFIYSLEKV